MDAGSEVGGRGTGVYEERTESGGEEGCKGGWVDGTGPWGQGRGQGSVVDAVGRAGDIPPWTGGWQDGGGGESGESTGRLDGTETEVLLDGAAETFEDLQVLGDVVGRGISVRGRCGVCLVRKGEGDGRRRRVLGGREEQGGVGCGDCEWRRRHGQQYYDPWSFNSVAVHKKLSLPLSNRLRVLATH